MLSNARKSAPPCMARNLVIAAVRVVLPWSTWPMVPTLTCGLLRSNFCLAMVCPSLLLTRNQLFDFAISSLAMLLGTSAYRLNSIEYVARPWVMLRSSVA